MSREFVVRERFYVEGPARPDPEYVMRATLASLLDYLEKNKPSEGFDPRGLYEAAIADVIAFRDLI